MALSKIFTGRFYAKNAAIFFLIFYIFFGTVPGNMLLNYHLGLIRGFTSNVDFMLLVLLVWGLYNAKCIFFVLNTLSSRESLYLYATVGVLDGMKKWSTWYRIHVSLYMPVLAYTVPAIGIAWHDKHFWAIWVMCIFHVLMIISALFFYDRKIDRPGTVGLFIRWQQAFNRRFRKPIGLLYIYGLLNNEVRSLFITKGVTALIIFATYTLMGTPFELRYMLVGWLLVILAHNVLVFNHRRFDDLQLALLPQLPLPLWKRYAHLILCYGTLLLPEFIFLTIKTYQMGSVIHIFLFIGMGISLLVLWRSLLYFPRLDQDKYFRWVLIIMVASLFMILAYWYWYIVIVSQLCAFIIFSIRYYRYEPPLAEVQ